MVEKQLSDIEKMGLEFLQEGPTVITELENYYAQQLNEEQRAGYYRARHLKDQELICIVERSGAAKLWGLSDKGKKALETGWYDFKKPEIKTAPALRCKKC